MKRLMTVIVSATALLALLGAVAATAQEQGSIRLTSTALKEVERVDADSTVTIERVPAATVVPGDVVIYVIEYENIGDENADNVFITNPIPEYMFYKEATARGEGTDITFSVDGGQSFDIPANLRVEAEDGTTRAAAGTDYTHIRWTLRNPLAPGATGTVEFRAQLQ